MPLPAGVSTATVTFGIPSTFQGDQQIPTTISVMPSANITHAATGTPIIAFIETTPAAANTTGQVILPHVDQSGFIDGNGNTFKNWYYTATITYTHTSDTRVITKNFQVTVGQATVDLDLLPTGVPAIPYTAPAPTVSSVVGQTGPVTGAQIAADAGVTAAFDPKGAQAQTMLQALPNLTKALTTQDDTARTTIRVLGLGSSVGLGPNGALDAVNAPSARFNTRLTGEINRLGNLLLSFYNGSVGGTTISGGQSTDYAAGKTAAGGTPKVVLLAYGMNDGRPGQYHAQQTLPGIYTNGKQLIQAIQSDGGDPVLMTSPHPHSTRYPWTEVVSGPIYSVNNPASTAVASVVTSAWYGGATVPASYRHLRANDQIRRLGADMGVPVLDAERYWFQAVATYGEDALFNTGEYVHPNLLGHQQSYWKAIDDFITGLIKPTVLSSTPPPTWQTTGQRFSTLISNPVLIPFTDKQYAILLVQADHPGVAARHSEAYLVLGDNGSSGVRIAAMGAGLPGNVVTVSAVGWNVKLTANFDNANIAWTIYRGLP